MKFSWKIFISTLLTVLFALSLGSTLLIAIFFNESVRSEVDQIEKDNLLMRTEIITLMSSYNKSVYRDKQEALKSILHSLSKNWKVQDKQFKITSDEDELIVENTSETGFYNMQKEKKSDNKMSYLIFNKNNNYYIQAKTYLTFDEQSIAVENCKDITNVFTTRSEQKNLSLKITFLIGILCAAINCFLTFWLTEPIRKLTKITKEIANGNMGVRVHSQSEDELGKLATNFDEMADALEDKVFELKEVARREEEFVGSFAHEIKTPLTSIIGYADLLRSQKLDDKTVFIAANYIFSEGKRLEGLSIKLLELLVERKQNLVYKNILLKKIIGDVLAAMRNPLQEKNINMVLDVKDIVIRADEDLMKTVLINIIDNARKAVDLGGKISIIATSCNNQVSLMIEDNGKGIPKEDLEKITEAFYMVDKSRSRKEGGAGLGLCICDQIMKLHNGEIKFESKVGYGTRVILTWKGDTNEM